MSASTAAKLGVGDATRFVLTAAAERYGRLGDDVTARAEPFGVMSVSSKETRASRLRGDEADGYKGPGDRRRVYEGSRKGLSTLDDRPLDERPAGAAAEYERIAGARGRAQTAQRMQSEISDSSESHGYGGNRDR